MQPEQDPRFSREWGTDEHGQEWRDFVRDKKENLAPPAKRTFRVKKKENT
jgi:hypothetical protein